MGRYDRGRAWYAKAREVIPWGTQTGAKWPEAYGELKDHVPYYVARAKGARFWDMDGNEFVDYRASLGPIILGHAHDEVDEAVRRQMEKGVLFSMASPIEFDVASALVDVIPCAERVRFLKTGGDAISACVRLARACTGRDKILTCGYHGWHDAFMAVTPVNRRGIPKPIRELSLPFAYNDLKTVQELAEANRGQVAAIVVNPFEGKESAIDFLKGLRELATREGMLLIFDEVRTGFRLDLGGAQGLFGVTPDLASFSKSMANGYPVSAFVGKKEVMGLLEQRKKDEENVMITTTFAGETLSLAACQATLSVLRRPGCYETLRETGRSLMRGLSDLSAKHGIPVQVQGLETWFTASLAGKLRDGGTANGLFYRRLLEQGIFCIGDWSITLSHSVREVEETLHAADRALETVKGELA